MRVRRRGWGLRARYRCGISGCISRSRRGSRSGAIWSRSHFTRSGGSRIGCRVTCARGLGGSTRRWGRIRERPLWGWDVRSLSVVARVVAGSRSRFWILSGPTGCTGRRFVRIRLGCYRRIALVRRLGVFAPRRLGRGGRSRGCVTCRRSRRHRCSLICRRSRCYRSGCNRRWVSSLRGGSWIRGRRCRSKSCFSFGSSWSCWSCICRIGGCSRVCCSITDQTVFVCHACAGARCVQTRIVCGGWDPAVRIAEVIFCCHRSTCEKHSEGCCCADGCAQLLSWCHSIHEMFSFSIEYCDGVTQ